MIKKICFATGIISIFMGFLNASETSDSVLKYYAKTLENLKGVKVKYVNSETYKGFEVINVDLIKNGEARKHFMFVKEGLLFNDILDLKTMKSYRETLKGEKFIELAKNGNDVLKIGSNANDVLWVFLDIECPYCKKYSGELRKLSKEKQINLVFLNVVGAEYGITKTVNLEKDFKKAKTDEERINVIEKYFSYSENNLKSSKDENQVIINRSKKYREYGIEYVPFTIEKGSSKWKRAFCYIF